MRSMDAIREVGAVNGLVLGLRVAGRVAFMFVLRWGTPKFLDRKYNTGRNPIHVRNSRGFQNLHRNDSFESLHAYRVRLNQGDEERCPTRQRNAPTSPASVYRPTERSIAVNSAKMPDRKRPKSPATVGIRRARSEKLSSRSVSCARAGLDGCRFPTGELPRFLLRKTLRPDNLYAREDEYSRDLHRGGKIRMSPNNLRRRNGSIENSP